jgi:hypothetical protein
MKRRLGPGHNPKHSKVEIPARKASPPLSSPSFTSSRPSPPTSAFWSASSHLSPVSPPASTIAPSRPSPPASAPSCPPPPFQTQPSFHSHESRQAENFKHASYPSSPASRNSPSSSHWYGAFPYSSHTGTRSAGPFDLDAFGGPTPTREVRVTGHDSDDEIGNFESEFPELEEPQVRGNILLACVSMPASRRTRPEY